MTTQQSAQGILAKLCQLRQRLLWVAAIFFVIGAGSIPLLGTAVHNIFFGLALLISLCTLSLSRWRNLFSYAQVTVAGLVLFAWLALSLSWSIVSVDEGIGSLKKYLEFLIIPVFAMVMIMHPKIRDSAALVFYVALLLSLIASYLIHFQLVDWTDNAHSLNNRIFHGTSMSIFAYLTLTFLLRESLTPKLGWQIFAVLMYIATAYSIFFIENGRTGYLCFLGLSCLAVAERMGLKRAMLVGSAGVISILLLYVFVAPDQARVLTGLDHELAADASLLSRLQVSDIRLEYYIVATLTYLQNWWLGFGVGAFETAYLATHQTMETFWAPTSNPHNEMLMLGIQGGIVAILLYLVFVFLLARFKPKETTSLTWQRSGLPMAGLIFVAGLFNSSIMDHGDGFLMMAAVSLLVSGAQMPAFAFKSARAQVAV